MGAVMQAFQRSAKKAGANEFTCIEVRTGDALAISDLVDTLRAQLDAAQQVIAEAATTCGQAQARAEAAEAECVLRLQAMRRAVLALAHAAESDRVYQTSYEELDAAIARTKEETNHE